MKEAMNKRVCKMIWLALMAAGIFLEHLENEHEIGG